MNLLFKAIGVWIAFDGLVSLTYWAWVDGTLMNKTAQAVRVVRTLMGVVLVVFG
jgi:threonine/homoserine/homoserine lactone efflux protein